MPDKMEYISREAAMNAMHTAWIGGLGFIHINPKDLERIPAADVAPVRHGRWIETEQWYGKRVQCNQCWHIPQHSGVFTASFWKVNCKHCPNCGADMQEATGNE